MPIVATRLRLGAVAIAAIALGASLTACSGPAGGAGSACPAGFIDATNAQVKQSGVDVTFAPASVADFQPSELQSFLASACVVAFSGNIQQGAAAGQFAFLTSEPDEAALGKAIEQLGFTGSGGTWTKPSSDTEVDVIAANTPSNDGTALVDLATVFPEAKYVVSSFHFKAG
ncbi:MAG: hypothetical protein BGO95_00300 [Micrococcales bacterium 73-13]|nr:MAG: hypothetical protein BGO95_00300 [Micrococcales bacterium 73-13]